MIFEKKETPVPCFTCSRALRVCVPLCLPFLHASPVPYPDVFWYRLNGMGAQKSSYNTFSISVSRKNWIKHSLQMIDAIDTNILPQIHWTLNIFGPSATTIGGYGVSLNYPILNFKKSVCPKSIWMQYCSSALIFLSALHAFTFFRVFTFLNVCNFWHALSALIIFMKCGTTQNQPQQAGIRQTE